MTTLITVGEVQDSEEILFIKQGANSVDLYHTDCKNAVCVSWTIYLFYCKFCTDPDQTSLPRAV